MKNLTKMLLTVAIVIIFLSLLPTLAIANQTFPDRLSGTTQYDTAAQIAEQGWAHGSSSAVLSAGMTGHTLVDALAAGTLASVWNIPIILTEGTNLTPAAAIELTKLRVTRVFVTSGTAVIQQPVLDALKAMGIGIIPLGGFDAAETSVNIAKAIAEKVSFSKIVLAGGSGADALSVASIAGAKNMPILYTDNAARLPVSVQSYLSGLSGINTSYVIGGSAVVSDSEKNQLLGTTIRYSGTSAYDTNKAVIQGFNQDFTFFNVFVANGNTLVDALAGVPLAAAKNAAVVLTDGTSLIAENHINSKLSSLSIVTALGGTKVVPGTVLMKLGYNNVSSPEKPNPEPSSAPLILYPKNNQSVMRFTNRPITVTWTEVPNAESYVLSLRDGSYEKVYKTVAETSYVIPDGYLPDETVILRVAAMIQGLEHWSQSVQIYVNESDPAMTGTSFTMDPLPKNIEQGKDIVLNWGVTGMTGQKSSPKGMAEYLHLIVGDFNADSTNPLDALVLETWLDARVKTYTIPASLLTEGHRYSVGLVGTNSVEPIDDPQDPNLFEYVPSCSNQVFWVNLQDLNPELEGSPLGPVIQYPLNPYLYKRAVVTWNSIPGANKYSCEIVDLTDRKIVETLYAQENRLTISSDFIKENYHLYRIRIAAIVNGQKNWGPSKTFENLVLGDYIPRISLPNPGVYTYPLQDIKISWTDIYPNQRNAYLVGQPVYQFVVKDSTSGKVVLSKDVSDITNYTIDKSLLLKGHDYTLKILTCSGKDKNDPNYFDTSNYESGAGFYISN